MHLSYSLKNIFSSFDVECRTMSATTYPPYTIKLHTEIEPKEVRRFIKKNVFLTCHFYEDLFYKLTKFNNRDAIESLFRIDLTRRQLFKISLFFTFFRFFSNRNDLLSSSFDTFYFIFFEFCNVTLKKKFLLFFFNFFNL